MDLASILQAIQRIRPDMLQGILGSLGGGMQSINGGGFRAEPFAPEPAGPSWSTRPFEPFPIPGRGGWQQFEPLPMPMPQGGGIPNQVVPDVPGAGSGGRSASMGSFGPGRLDLPGLRQPMPERYRNVPGLIGVEGSGVHFGGSRGPLRPLNPGGGNQIATRPAPGGRRMGGAVVRPSPGGRGNAVDPWKRAGRAPKRR